MNGTEPDSRVGSHFGPYRLERLLGRGGMGEVYQAEDTVKDRVVALKLLSKTYSQDPVFRKRMQREARTAGRLQEPHVVPIHDYGEIDGQLYIDMRLIEGTDLRAVLIRSGPLDPPRAVAIVRQVASALDAAHAAGVMHRDVKPENILITRDDFAYLVDFGIAAANTDEHLTDLGTTVGTWRYMAPERFTSAEVTYRADIYALTCVLHECLTGSAPYRMNSASTLITAHLMDPIPKPSLSRPGIPHAFDTVIARGMAKNPDDRYASAGDLALAAHEALSTPDQDHSTTIFRRSQQSQRPGEASIPAAPTVRYPRPGDSGRLARSVPAPSTGPNPTPSRALPGGRPTAPPPFGPRGGVPPDRYRDRPPGPSAPSPWPVPHTATPPRKRSRWLPISIGVAVVSAVLGGVGVWLAWPDPAPSHPSALPPTIHAQVSSSATSRPASPKPPSDAEARLLHSLPIGYSADVCMTTPVSGTIWPDALAIVNCGQTSNPNSPPSVWFASFTDISTLNAAFDQTTKTDRLADTCPGGSKSPTAWSHPDTPTVPRGMMACGTFRDTANVIWTDNARQLLGSALGDMQGYTLEKLYPWWTMISYPQS